ncbi:hypothetical protein KAR48_20540 [bacterium]|nr:hypothetical protein [bacterium]
MAFDLLYYDLEGDYVEQIIAFTIWKERISPLFDSSMALLILCVNEGREISRDYVTLETATPASRAAELSELSIEVLICGAISQPFAGAIESKGIHIIPFIAGHMETIIDSFLKGTLLHLEHQMPGCGRKRRMRFRGGRI